MTDRLTDLLHTEADLLDVPPPPAAGVLARGRGLRRRRRWAASGVAATVVALVVATVLTVAGGRDPGRRAVDPVAPPAPAPAVSGAVFSVGPTVYLDDGRVSAAIDDVTVKSLYYTSAGVLVRHGLNNYSDGGGPQRFSLVRPDGTMSPVGVTTEETVHATDPNQPYLAYAQLVGRTVHVLVHDVVSDAQVADVVVPGDQSDFSPLSLEGDVVYLGDGETVHVVDWRTGEITNSTALKSPIVSGGHAVVSDGTRGSQIVDASTGAVLLPAPIPTSPDEFGYLILSPDGRHAIYDPQTMEETGGFDVYDVASGAHVTLDGMPYDYGWTPDDQLFSVDEDGTLATCSPDTGDCTTTTLDLPVQPGSAGGDDDFSSNLQLGGRTYES